MALIDGVLENFPLKELTWWKVGGPAQYFSKAKTVDELKAHLLWAKNEGFPVTVLSGGSNVLISDKGISGLVVSMSELTGIEVLAESPNLELSVWAGTPKSELAKIFLKHQLAPAVFLTGIPGDVGGGVVMNAGVGEQRVPREFCEITTWVEVLKDTGHEFKVERIEALDWEYRKSSGWQPGVIARVGIQWPNQPNKEVMKQVREATKNRVAKQPLNLPSGGSTFRNPEGGKAAQLIDSCGLKGFRVGGAQVSEKHANFIVNDQNGSASDIAAIIEHMQNTVLEKTGVKLHREVIFLGEF